ncbi:hypothetical protein [Thermostaphylospora chromogena]|uniref:Uncharacterized protein n=1 Tax=Thermostaphylospora chromogena TaxID=35622 RepID=A0A1H1FUU5_9ACTN|nr:hypothetical protein [Thermostaphylospora chromogena]SDR04640.1 hypothetical protein SAMN04489764_3193 [Thermostaphylospora chromogena]
MGQIPTVRAIDDAMVTIDTDAVRTGEVHAWTGHVRYAPGHGGNEAWALELAPRSALSAGVASVGGTERERFTLAGGEVVVYDCADPPNARWAAWLGPWHMAHGMFYPPLWEPWDVVEAFTRLRWTDTPQGLTATSDGRFRLHRAIYLLPVAGVGTVRVEPRALAPIRPPRWRGYPTAAGEMWRLPGRRDPREESLLMVTDTAVVTVSPWDAPRKGPAARRENLSAGPEAGTAEAAARFLAQVADVRWGA